jgi:hypothetical protein
MNPKTKYQVLYKNPSVNGLNLYIILFTFSCILIVFLFLFVFQNLIWFISVISLTSAFIIFYSFTHGYWHDITKYYLENLPNMLNFKENAEYATVVIADNHLKFGKYFHIYNGGVLLLIEHLRARGIPTKIIRKATQQDVHEVVYDHLCTELYIFGHGRKYGLRINNKDLLKYSDFTNAPPKKRIEQFHCNHKAKKGISLASLLHAEERYSTDKKRTIEEVINCCLFEFFS